MGMHFKLKLQLLASNYEAFFYKSRPYSISLKNITNSSLINKHCCCKEFSNWSVSGKKRGIYKDSQCRYICLKYFKVGSILPLKFNNMKFRNFHQGRSQNCVYSGSDIPPWLKDVVNEVPGELQEISCNNELEDKGFVMGNEITDFFLSRAITYEDLDSSFVVGCPSCRDKDLSHDLFIDKESGFCVCPGCYWEGCWEDFIELLNTKESCLSESRLENIISSSTLLQDAHEPLLLSFPFSLGIEKLKEMSARISEDHSIVYIPIKGEEEIIVGFASISLLHPSPAIFLRLLEENQGIFSTFSICKRTTKKVLVTSNIMSALKLAKLKIPSLVLIGNHNEFSHSWIFNNFKNIVLWYEDDIVPSELLTHLTSKNMNIFLVKANHSQKISMLSNKKIISLITDAIPIMKDSIIKFSDIESEVYDRLCNKDQIYGTKWIRFKEMNEFLLGHRQGELTVLSGPTGCGKTTFMSEYSLDLCMQGVLTLWGSFEISVPRLCEVMMQQYSGSPLSENYSEFKILASKFAELPLYFFNTHGQQPIQEVVDVMINAVLLKGVQHIVIDNLQFMLGFNGTSMDWWLEQDRAVGAFRNFATSYNCHVTLIVHPRKLALGEKLNMNTISGGARVTQEADNVMLLQVSENKDGSRNPLGPKTLQIVKNRYGGTLGEMKLRFHKDSLTLSSCFGSKSKDGKGLKSVQEGLESLAASKGLPSLNWESW